MLKGDPKMKRKVIGVFLAVVLVMTLFLGTFGYAHAAKGYIEISEGSFLLHDADTDGSYQLYGTATIHGKRVSHYAVEWFSNHSGSFASLGVWEYTLSTPSKTGTIGFQSNDNLQNTFCGDDFYCIVYLTNARFKLNDRKSYTSDIVTLTCD
jgi:hypothetical protein